MFCELSLFSGRTPELIRDYYYILFHLSRILRNLQYSHCTQIVILKILIYVYNFFYVYRISHIAGWGENFRVSRLVIFCAHVNTAILYLSGRLIYDVDVLYIYNFSVSHSRE